MGPKQQCKNNGDPFLKNNKSGICIPPAGTA